MDKSGFPVVVNHHIAEGRPDYYDHLKLRGRKVTGVDVGQRGKAVFKTGALGKPGFMRQLHASLPGHYTGPWFGQDELKYVDLGEVTGRIMVVIGIVPFEGRDDIPYVQQLCLADLPI